jgi:precorrin-2 dehydrogenase/sirohydrochlorin ferrochelatase
MSVFPLFIDLKGRKCIIIGGGNVAARKVEILLQFGAHLVVISPKLIPELEAYKEKGAFIHIDRLYCDKDIEGAFLVIAATSDNEANERIYNTAVKLNIFVNVVDDPEKCTFLFPSVIKKDDLVIGVSTSGSFPMLSKALRKKIENIVPMNFDGDLTGVLRQWRERARSNILDTEKRKEFMNRVLDLVFDNQVKDSRKLDVKIKIIFGEY